MVIDNRRTVCHFSCGAASAVATKIVLSEKQPEVLILRAYLEEEHADNDRFAADCERWFGQPITVLRDQKYGSSAFRVWEKKRYIKGPYGAPCSQHLKRELLATVARPDDIHVLGYTAEEEDRFIDRQQHASHLTFRAPLIERGLKKSDCLAMIMRAGIELPAMYKLGYANNNCIGCPKGGQGYWQAIRRDFPEQFEKLATLQEELGKGAYFLQFRSGPRKGARMSLRDLPPGEGRRNAPLPSCSFFCEIAEEQYED